MKTNLLSSDKDPMGTAIADYFHHNKADKLRVFSSQFEEDEIPVNQLFRPYDEMPELEQIALQIAEGNILDVGAGSATATLAAARRSLHARSPASRSSSSAQGKSLAILMRSIRIVWPPVFSAWGMYYL